MATADHIRHADIITPQQMNSVGPYTLIGGGAVGSFVGLELLSLGVEDLTVYDPDRVEEVNVPSQLPGPRHVGMLKVEALAEIYELLTGLSIKPVPQLYPMPSEPPAGIIIGAIDSMGGTEEHRHGRIELWHQCIKDKLWGWYVDTRMGAEEGRIYVINPFDPDHQAVYEASLYTSDEAMHEPCTARSTPYCAMYMGSIVAYLMKELVLGRPVQPETRFMIPPMVRRLAVTRPAQRG